MLHHIGLSICKILLKPVEVDTTRFEQEEVAAERLLKLYHSTHYNKLYFQEKCSYQKSTLKHEVLPQLLQTYLDPWTSDIQGPWRLL